MNLKFVVEIAEALPAVTHEAAKVGTKLLESSGMIKTTVETSDSTIETFGTTAAKNMGPKPGNLSNLSKPSHLVAPDCPELCNFRSWMQDRDFGLDPVNNYTYYLKPGETEPSLYQFGKIKPEKILNFESMLERYSSLKGQPASAAELESKLRQAYTILDHNGFLNRE